MVAPTAPLSRMRRVFLIVVDNGLELATYADVPVSTGLGEFLDMVVKSTLEHDVDQISRLQNSSDCVVFDDAMQQLPNDIRVGSIPAPGILYIIPKAATSLADLGRVS
ncbi:hypothetical protein [Arthrobacter sp. 754]|uniref:hypothetical protein n=1 Tax=Arthrobacter sp. 754 TaxID=3156315 RepID=UPI00339A6FB0